MPSRLRGDINITPLIDIVLVLLIAFITFVPVLPRALSAALPGRGEGAPGKGMLRLTLERDGSLRVAEQPGGSLAAALAMEPGRVLLRVHPDLPLSAPTRVLDEIEGRHPGLKVAVVAWPP